MDNPRTITLDEPTLDLMSAVLSLAELAADAQINDEDRADAHTLITSLAELCGYPAYDVEVKETHNEDGSVDVHIATHEINTDNHKKPNLTLISNDNMDKSD